MRALLAISGCLWAWVGAAGPDAGPQRVVVCNDCLGSRIIVQPHFARNSAQVRPEDLPILQEVGKVLAQHPDLEVVGLLGHASVDEAQPQRLSERRAQAVVEALVKLGVKREQLEPHGWGKERPIADPATARGREQSRRVELRIYRRGGEEVERWAPEPTGSTRRTGSDDRLRTP